LQEIPRKGHQEGGWKASIQVLCNPQEAMSSQGQGSPQEAHQGPQEGSQAPQEGTQAPAHNPSSPVSYG